MRSKKRLLLLLALILLMAGEALAQDRLDLINLRRDPGQTYRRDLSYATTLAIIRGQASGQQYRRDLSYSPTLAIIRLGAPSQPSRRDISYSSTLAIIRGEAPGQSRRDLSYAASIRIIAGEALGQFKRPITYSPSLAILCDQCGPAQTTTTTTTSVIIKENPTLSFALMLALIGVPALVLASAGGAPGLFVGLLIGGAMAFMAGLLPPWLIVLLGLAMFTLIAFMKRGRQE